MKALELRDVTASYGRAEVLHGISLTIEAGQLVSLLGPNGAGKTTLLKAVAGKVATRGAITVAGCDVLDKPAHERPALGIGHCPEGRRLFGELTVLKNLVLGAYSRSDRHEVEKDLDKVFSLFPRLKERAKQAASTMSGGEQQMVAIGRALMSRPKLLMLDEPSVGIAPRLKTALFETIQQIRTEGVALLLVEQDVRMALRISDYVYILEAGQIVAKGSRQELSNQEHIRRAFLGL